MRCKEGIAMLGFLRINHCKGESDYNGQGKKLSERPPKNRSSFLRRIFGSREQKIKSESDLMARHDADKIKRSSHGIPFHPANK